MANNSIVSIFLFWWNESIVNGSIAFSDTFILMLLFVFCVLCLMDWVLGICVATAFCSALTVCLLTINKISDFVLGSVLHVSLKATMHGIFTQRSKPIMNHHNFTMFHQAIRLICFAFLFTLLLGTLSACRRLHSVYFASLDFSTISMSVVDCA